MSSTNTPESTAEISDVVQSLAYLDDIQRILTARQSDLSERMKFKTYCLKIKTNLQSYMGTLLNRDVAQTKKQSTEDLIVPESTTDSPVLSSRVARVDRKKLAEDLNKAVLSFDELLDLLSNYTDSADKTIISVNAIVPAGRQAKNTFNGSVQTLRLVFSTNSGSYVVTQADDGTLMLTQAKYWIDTQTKS